MSVLNDILDGIVSAQTTLALKVEGRELGVVKRKLPKKEEPVDLAYQVTVSGAEKVDKLTRIGFGGCWQAQYNIDITLLTPNDHDALLNLPDHAAWREATRALFQTNGAIAVDVVKRVDIVDSPFLDRSQLAKGYDYNQVTLQITTYERRV